MTHQVRLTSLTSSSLVSLTSIEAGGDSVEAIFVLTLPSVFRFAVALAASAIQLMDSKEQLEKAKLQRQWALFEPNTILTVKKNRDPKLDEYPELTLEGSVGYPVALVSGRWMQYQVRDSPAEEERGFVTVVRYTPECPTGKATALYNWKSGAMEVDTISMTPIHAKFSSTSDVLGYSSTSQGLAINLGSCVCR